MEISSIDLITTLAHKVRTRWKLQHIAGPFVDPSAIATLEERVGPLPAEYLRFLQIAGTQEELDDNRILFWSVERVATAKEILSEAGHDFVAGEDAIIIADYMQECWCYGLWTTGRLHGQVSIVRGGDSDALQRPIGAFAEFLQAYLSDDQLLYRLDAS